MNDFNRIAFIYDRLAKLVFGNSIVESQRYFLNRIPNHVEILILGGGTGWILTELLRVKPDVKVCYIEASSKMISMARTKINSSIQFIHGTENDIPERSQFDVVITNFYLDLFTDESMGQALTKIKKTLRPGGQWIATDFVNTNCWQDLMLKVMYSFFRMSTNIEARKLPHWNTALGESGGRKTESNFHYKGFIETSLFQF